MVLRKLVIIAVPLLATCNEGTQAPPLVERQQRGLGKMPASETASWQSKTTSNSPGGRFMHAAAWDDKRRVVVMFGGVTYAPSSVSPCNQELWEWNPATAQWTNHTTTATGTAPGARAGAAMVYDAKDDVFVLFGGRTNSGVNYEDTWEWNPSSGVWTDRTSAGSHPSARAQHGMVYQTSTGKVLLYGGGSSDSTAWDPNNVVTLSCKDTWEYDPATHAWADRSTSQGPGARHDLGLVWDTTKKRAVLFGGLQVDTLGATPVPKQDTWEWDPSDAGTWTERTTTGDKPSLRYGHAMAYDGSRGKIVLFAGWDGAKAGVVHDLWDYDPTSFAWTQRLTGSESGLPSARAYAALVSDAQGHLELLGGAVAANDKGITLSGSWQATGSNELWELDAAKPAFTNKTAAQDTPAPRGDHAMAYDPISQKVYVFGGADAQTGSVSAFGDLWSWDGKVWSKLSLPGGPSPTMAAAMAYDPVRKALILYGGSQSHYGSGTTDTWQLDPTAGTWTKLATQGKPGWLVNHGMVTDSARGKILLFGGSGDHQDNHVWEWDGAALTWTDRSLSNLYMSPGFLSYPIMAYDEERQKLIVYEGMARSNTSPGSASAFWEWDPVTAGWTTRDSGDRLDAAHQFIATYDSLRRRVLIHTDAPSGWSQQTLEIDTKTPTWYVRTLTNTPFMRGAGGFVFDSHRGVAVLFGGFAGAATNDTWEYRVTNLGEGERCTAGSVTTCESGNCVDGFCCKTASCAGPCQACNVTGSEGTCATVRPGTEVAGSCDSGQACDGSGACKSKNGQPCGNQASCASGFCVDGICCDTACTGTCVACNLAGRAGTCSPQPAGTDPKNQCGAGDGECKSTCDGVGACDFPGWNMRCQGCGTCDSRGKCNPIADLCNRTGGTTGTTTIIDKNSGGSTGQGGAGGKAGAGGMGGEAGAGGAGGSAGAGGNSGQGGSSNSGGAAGGNGGNGGSGGRLAASGGRAGSGGVFTSSGGTNGQGGAAVKHDGGADAAGTFKSSHSGCSCVIGQAPVRPSFLVGVLLGLPLLIRSRRRRH